MLNKTKFIPHSFILPSIHSLKKIVQSPQKKQKEKTITHILLFINITLGMLINNKKKVCGIYENKKDKKTVSQEAHKTYTSI